MRLAELAERSEYLLPATRSAYQHALERFQTFCGGDPARYTAATLEAFRDDLRGHGMAPATINKHVYAVRWASRRLAQLGAGADFAQGAEAVRNPSRTHRRALSVDEVRAVLTAIGADPADPVALRDRALLVAGLRTGLRVSELCQLTFADVAGGVFRGRGKGDRELAAVIDAEAQGAVGDWDRWLADHRVKRKGTAVFRSVHPAMDGYRIGEQPISRVAAHRILSARGRAAGVPLSAHLLRHTFVTWALEAGVPPWRIMGQTGQAHMATLMKYAHDLRAAEDPVGGYLPRLL